MRGLVLIVFDESVGEYEEFMYDGSESDFG